MPSSPTLWKPFEIQSNRLILGEPLPVESGDVLLDCDLFAEWDGPIGGNEHQVAYSINEHEYGMLLLEDEEKLARRNPAWKKVAFADVRRDVFNAIDAHPAIRFLVPVLDAMRAKACWPCKPWSDETIAALAEHQSNGRIHPYTCGNDSRHVLKPTRDGWVCPECNYRQNWAHGASDLRRPNVTLLHPVATQADLDNLDGFLRLADLAGLGLLCEPVEAISAYRLTQALQRGLSVMVLRGGSPRFVPHFKRYGVDAGVEVLEAD